MKMRVYFGTKLTFLGLFVAFLGLLFFLINCTVWILPWCEGWRNIPVISDLELPFIFIGLGMFVLGMIIHTIQTSGKTEFPTDEDR
jgi:hypothetical protein